MSCIVKSCRNYKNRNRLQVSFHQFPRDKWNQGLWLEALGIEKENWKWSPNKIVCSVHFLKEDFVVYPWRRGLRRSVVPSLHLHSVAELSEIGTSQNPNMSTDITTGTSSSKDVSSVPQKHITTTSNESQNGQGFKRKSRTGSEDNESDTSTDSSTKRRSVVKFVHNYSDTENSCTTFKKASILASPSSEEELEFLTVVEDIDDSDEDCMDQQELPQTSLNSESQDLPPLLTQIGNNFSNSDTVAGNRQVSAITTETRKNITSSDVVAHNSQEISSPLTKATTKKIRNSVTEAHNSKQVSSSSPKTNNNFISPEKVACNIQQVSSLSTTQTWNNVSSTDTVAQDTQVLPLTTPTRNNFSSADTVTSNILLEKQTSPKLILIPTGITYPIKHGNPQPLQFQPLVSVPLKGMANSNLLIQNPFLTTSPIVRTPHVSSSKPSLVNGNVMVTDTSKATYNHQFVPTIVPQSLQQPLLIQSTQPLSPPKTSLSNGNATIMNSSQLDSSHMLSAATSPLSRNLAVVNNLNDKYPSAEPNGCNSPITLTTDDDENEKQEAPRRKKRRKPLPRFFGDCSSDDMETPSRAKVSWSIAKRTISELKNRVKTLQRQKSNYAQQVECLRSLLHYLEENNFLNQYADAVIKAVLPKKAHKSSSSS